MAGGRADLDPQEAVPLDVGAGPPPATSTFAH